MSTVPPSISYDLTHSTDPLPIRSSPNHRPNKDVLLFLTKREMERDSVLFRWHVSVQTSCDSGATMLTTWDDRMITN